MKAERTEATILLRVMKHFLTYDLWASVSAPAPSGLCPGLWTGIRPSLDSSASSFFWVALQVLTRQPLESHETISSQKLLSSYPHIPSILPLWNFLLTTPSSSLKSTLYFLSLEFWYCTLCQISNSWTNYLRLWIRKEERFILAFGFRNIIN